MICGHSATSTPNQSDYEETDTSTGSGSTRLNVAGGAQYKDLKMEFEFPLVHQEIFDSPSQPPK